MSTEQPSPLRWLPWLAGAGGAAWWLSRQTVSLSAHGALRRPTPAMDPEFKRIAAEVDRALKDRKLPRLKGAVASPSGLTFTFGPNYARKKGWDDDAVDAAMEVVLATHRWFRKGLTGSDRFYRDDMVASFHVAADAGGGDSRVVYGRGAEPKPRKRPHAKKGSAVMFTGFDLFDDASDEPENITRATAFRDSGSGHVFHAQGRDWMVINSPGDADARIIRGHPARRVRSKGGNFEHEPALYASLDGETLIVRALAKRGPFAPVGKVLWREDMSDKA